MFRAPSIPRGGWRLATPFRRGLRLGFGVLAIAGASACGDDGGPTDPSARVQGEYALRTFDGQPLPLVVWDEESEKLELLSGSMELRSQNRFLWRMETRYTFFGEVDTDVDLVDGTFAVDGGTITFTSDGESLTGTLSGNTLTLELPDFFDDGESLVLEFRK